MMEITAHGKIVEIDAALGPKDYTYKVEFEDGDIAYWLKSDILMQRFPGLFSRVKSLSIEYVSTLKVGDRLTLRFVEVDGQNIGLELEPHFLSPVPIVEQGNGVIIDIDDINPSFGGKDFRYKVQLADGTFAYKMKDEISLDAHRHLGNYSYPVTERFMRNCGRGDAVKISYAKSKGINVILTMVEA